MTTTSRQHDGITHTCETCGHDGIPERNPCRSCVRTGGEMDMWTTDAGHTCETCRHNGATILKYPCRYCTQHYGPTNLWSGRAKA